jgi:lysyl endopeptidase
MKKILLCLGLALNTLHLNAQFTSLVPLKGTPNVKVFVSKNVPTLIVNSPSREQLDQEDQLRDNQGKLYRVGVAQFSNATLINSGLWTNLGNGMKVWQLKVNSKDAEAMTFTFKHFNLSTGAQFWIENKTIGYSTKMYDKSCMLDDGQFVTDFVWGEDLVLNLLQPENEIQSEIEISRIFHNYRSTGTPYVTKFHNFGASAACEVNANCPAGSAWTNQNRGVAMINVIEGANQGFCSGSLINNLANDCKPYFLTANHCGISSSTADFALWKFHFRFEATACTNPASVGSLATHFVTGCLKIASTVDGGDTSSDFLFLKLGTATNEAAVITTLKSASFGAYWNGWEAAATVSAGGFGFHHPAGDIKKLSTFTATPVAGGFNNATYTSHWRFSWAANASGYGVTEGGSSGSPLFNNAGKIIGTLTGGGSFCNNQTAQDLYGKFAWHWTNAQNGSTNSSKLKPWLDPNNTGLTTQAGSLDPCTVTAPLAPVAQFVGVPTTVTTGGTVAFTDQSTNAPTSWSWVITPSTGWAYAAGSTATSQNPSVVFNTAGTYTVQLTSTNAIGSDPENKVGYIIVNDPVAATCITPTVGGWSMGFEATDDQTGLSTLNVNADTSIWGVYSSSPIFASHSGANYAGYQYTTAMAANDFLTMPCFSFNTGTTYKVSYWYKAQLNNPVFPETMTVKLGATNNSAAGFTQTIFSHPSITNTTYVQNTATFTVATSGNYYITFHCTSAADQYVLSLDDINIGIQPSNVSLGNSLFDQVSLYPNPANDELNIDLTTVTEKTTIDVLDITGKVVKTIRIDGSNIATLDIKFLANGTYNVRMSNSNGSIIKRFVKK